MAKRKPWDQLKPGYQKRLRDHGITPESHAAGASIKAARSHEKTPERPSGYNAEKFPEYANRRNMLLRQFEQKKEQLWGNRPRWKKERANMSLRKSNPSMALLRWALEADEEELLDALRDDRETYRFIGYH